MESLWESILVYTPIFYLLSRGWICFIFCSKADVGSILAGCWYWNCHLLCAKPWHPLFDAREEVLSSMATWIKLPNLPLEFWSDSNLKAIGEVLGTFITFDTNYKSCNFRLVAQILVVLDPRQGLYESM
jgi:hypothetical protein